MFFIRAEGNEKIGAGHVMRMLALAEELKSRVSSLTFLCREEQARLAVLKRGYACRTLRSCAHAPLFSSEEAEAVADLLTPGDRILIDSYLITDEYLEILRTKATVMVMDDVIGYAFRADTVVNYNLYADRQQYLDLYRKAGFTETEMPEFITGSSYMPVRADFFGGDFRVEDRVRKVMITAGGADEHNMTAGICREILDRKRAGGFFSGMEFLVICGAYNTHFDALVKEFGKEGIFDFRQNVSDMPELMKACDAAVSAGGSTCNELCASGVPFVCFALADNQVRASESYGEKECALYAGTADLEKDPDPDTKKELCGHIADLLLRLTDSRELRLKLSRKARETVIPRGGANLAEMLVKGYTDKVSSEEQKP